MTTEENENFEHPPCDFLAEHIGRISLNELKQHIEECQDCQEDVTAHWNDYSGNRVHLNDGWISPIEDMSAIPAGVSRDDFLSAWHIAVKRKAEEFEMRVVNIFQRLFTHDGFVMLQKFLKAHTMLLEMVALDTPQEIINRQKKIILKVWIEFRGFLGPKEFAYLIDVDPESFYPILEIFKKMLG